MRFNEEEILQVSNHLWLPANKISNNNDVDSLLMSWTDFHFYSCGNGKLMLVRTSVVKFF